MKLDSFGLCISYLPKNQTSDFNKSHNENKSDVICELIYVSQVFSFIYFPSALIFQDTCPSFQLWLFNMRGKKSIKLPIVIYIQILCDYRQIVQLEMNQNKLHSYTHYTNIQKTSFFLPFYSHKRRVLYKTKNRKCIENFSKGPFRIFSVTQQQKDMFDARFDTKPRTKPFCYVYFLSPLFLFYSREKVFLSQTI